VVVEATIIEKTLSHTDICFWYYRRKNHRVFRCEFYSVVQLCCLCVEIKSMLLLSRLPREPCLSSVFFLVLFWKRSFGEKWFIMSRVSLLSPSALTWSQELTTKLKEALVPITPSPRLSSTAGLIHVTVCQQLMHFTI